MLRYPVDRPFPANLLDAAAIAEGQGVAVEEAATASATADVPAGGPAYTTTAAPAAAAEAVEGEWEQWCSTHLPLLLARVAPASAVHPRYH